MSGFFATPAIPTLTGKSPVDAGPWGADFSNVLPTGDTIASIVSVTAVPNDLVVGSTAITAGVGGANLRVGIQLSGGTAGLSYQVTTEITSTQGLTRARSFNIPALVR